MRYARRTRLSVAALLPVLGLAVACAGTEKPAGAAKGAGRDPVATRTTDRSAPLTGTELEAALLTEAEATGFTITDSGSRDGAATRDLGKETAEPEACLALRRVRSENAPDRGESAMARSVMYLGDSALWPRKTVLTSYPPDTARARMAELRRAVDSCGRYDVRNAFGAASVTTETLPVPHLGDEAVRYRTLGRLELSSGRQGWDYSLVTVVRTGGVIASVETAEAVGPFTSEQLEQFKPEPGPDELMIAALVEKVSGAAAG